MASNPYYAYISIQIGGNSPISNQTDGVVNMQAKYIDDANCEFLIEVYDDTAHKLAEQILYSNRQATVSYGYSDQSSRKTFPCMITNLHTELTGTGEVLTLELVPNSLYNVNTSASSHNEDSIFYGSSSERLKQALAEIGWSAGTIVTTVDLPGDNNFNDDINIAADAKDYDVWLAGQTLSEYISSLQETAITADGKGNFVVSVNYETSPPTVSFFPAQDAGKYNGSKNLSFVYGRGDQDIISISVDWGDALLVAAGMAGIEMNSIGTINNEPLTTEQSAGVVTPTKRSRGTSTTTVTTTTTNRSDKDIKSGDNKQTWYGTLTTDSKAFDYTISQNPGRGMETWNREYDDNGVMRWGGYVVVAADISGNYGAEYDSNTGTMYPELINHEGRFERGDLVETTYGTGIVVDACRAAVDYDGILIDVAKKG